MRVAIADDYTHLCAHALAHISLPGPGNLFDARYVAWAASRLPDAAVEPVRRDAALLAARYAAVDRALLLHVVPDLHDGIASFLATAAKPIEALTARDVSDASALRLLLSIDRPLVELLRAAMALAAPAFASAFDATISTEVERSLGAVGRALDAVADVFSLGEDERLELVHAMGVHGRGLAGRVLVGAPAPWATIEPEHSVVVALHERAVGAAASNLPASLDEHERYLRSEISALSALARAMRDAPPSLGAAHERWLASLDLGPLREGAAASEIPWQDPFKT